MSDDFAVGLDLGTTNSCIGVYRNGGVEIIPNTIGEKITPSIVTILDNEILVGEETFKYLVKECDRTIFEVKRLIGRKFNDKEIQEEIKILPYSIINSGENGEIKISVNRNGQPVEFGPVEISSFIIKKLVKDAEEYLNHKINQLIITVPAYFDNSQRNLTKQAAELLGINVPRIVNEPTAAALAYGLDKKKSLSNKDRPKPIETPETNSKYILIFDLGGGTFDVSLLFFNETLKSFEVKGVSGDSHLGGEDFDNKLCEYCLKYFCEKLDMKYMDIKKDIKAIKKLKMSCENAKKLLSKSNYTILNIPNLYQSNNLYMKITRQDFEDICQDLFDKLIIPLKTVLYNAKLNNSDIEEIVLVGGSTHIPKIKSILKEFFTNSKINDLVNPDETVAYGATLLAGKILCCRDEIIPNFILQDVTPLSLGIGIFNENLNNDIKKLGDIMSVIIPKGTRIPTKEFKKKYFTGYDNQDSALVEVYEGERKYTKKNNLLGQFTLIFEPRPRGEVSVEVSFQIDINGILNITAVDGLHGNRKEVQIIQDTINLSIEDIKKLQEKNKPDIQKLSVIKNKDPTLGIKQRLKTFLKGYEESKDDEDKYDAISNYIEEEDEYIQSIEENSFDNSTLLEKYFNFVKDLFSSYIKKLRIESQITKVVRKTIKDNIKKYLQNFSHHTLGYLNLLLEELENGQKLFFYDIVIYCMYLMNKNGKNCLLEGKKFCKGDSIMFFEESLLLGKKYIKNESELSSLEINLLPEYLQQKKISEEKLEEVKSNIIILIEDPKKIGRLILGTGTGFTIAVGQFNNSEKEQGAYENLLISYRKALGEVQSNIDREPSEVEAYLLANIIQVDWKLLGGNEYNRYLKMAEECNSIIKKIKLDENKEWYKEFKVFFNDLKESAINQNNIYSNIMRECMDENTSIFKEIDNFFNNKNNMEFIKFILKRHPYNGYEEDSKIKGKFFENYTKELLHYLKEKYDPDNYLLNNDEDVRIRFSIIYYIYKKLLELISKL